MHEVTRCPNETRGTRMSVGLSSPTATTPRMHNPNPPGFANSIPTDNLPLLPSPPCSRAPNLHVVSSRLDGPMCRSAQMLVERGRAQKLAGQAAQAAQAEARGARGARGATAEAEGARVVRAARVARAARAAVTTIAAAAGQTARRARPAVRRRRSGVGASPQAIRRRTARDIKGRSGGPCVSSGITRKSSIPAGLRGRSGGGRRLPGWGRHEQRADEHYLVGG